MKVVNYANAIVGYDGTNMRVTHGQTSVVETTWKAEKGMG
jgi:hypothetical protein